MSLSRSTALREIARLEKINAKLVSAMGSLDRFHRDDVKLSVEEAKSSLARSQAWVVDAIQCLRIDSGLETDG